VSGLSKIVKNVASVFIVPGLIFGAYVVAHGHLTPGGGFQGGTIIATTLALLLVAFGEKSFRKAIGKNALAMLESLALFGFIGIAFLGLQSSFFNNFLSNSGSLFGQSVQFGVNEGNINSAGVIPLMNFMVGIEVASGLTIIVIAMYSGWGERK